MRYPGLWSSLVLLSLLVASATGPAAEPATVSDRVRAELATLLKKDAGTLPVDKPVLELGADDLTVVEWTMALDKAFGIRIANGTTFDEKKGGARKDLTVSAMTELVNEALEKRQR